jgi:glycosyltransferase involved in cell wall biosynthesis
MKTNKESRQHQPMKIVVNALGPSKVKAGVGNYLLNLISELSLIDKENKYLIFTSSQNMHYYSNENSNFNVIDIGFWGRNKLLRIVWEQLILPLQVIDYKADILFSPGFVCPLVKTSKNVTVIHDMTFFSHPQVHTFFKRIYFPFMIKQAVKRSEKIIAVSKNTKKEIIKFTNIVEKKIAVTLLAANRFPTSEITDEKKFLEEKYGIASDYLLFVGMIEPRKNINLIIESLTKIEDEDIKLVIVGKKGWMTEELFERIKVNNLENKVIFTGFVPDKELSVFYKNARVFLYPSLYEGFGIPVLEAMSQGCPVITSNISSLPEVVGGAAILIDPENPEELADAVNKICKDDKFREELILKGFENAKKFSWKKTAQQTLGIFEEIGHKI